MTSPAIDPSAARPHLRLALQSSCGAGDRLEAAAAVIPLGGAAPRSVDGGALSAACPRDPGVAVVVVRGHGRLGDQICRDVLGTLADALGEPPPPDRAARRAWLLDGLERAAALLRAAPPQTGFCGASIAVALVVVPDPRGALVLPLLVPLALIAALEIDTLKRGFSAALDWFGILTFGLLAALLWWLWIDAWWHGMAPAVARLFRDTEAGYRPPVGIAALAISGFLTLLWLALVRPARRSNRRAALNWAAGMTLLWGLYMTIWLPYLDSRRSYRPVALSLAAQVPATGCVASRRLGEPQRALFDYFAGLRTVREELRPDHGCALLLVQHGRNVGESAPAQGWTAAWTGRRQGDDTELYVLYTRTAP